MIDFDDCGFGWHVMDLATSLLWLLGQPQYEHALAGFVAGYRSARALPDEHLEMLPVFLLARAMTYVGWCGSRPETPMAQEKGPMVTRRCNTVPGASVRRRSVMSTVTTKPWDSPAYSERKRRVLDLAHEYLIPGRVETFVGLGIPLVVGRREGYRFWDIDGHELRNSRSASRNPRSRSRSFPRSQCP